MMVLPCSGTGANLSDTRVPFGLPGEPGHLITGKAHLQMACRGIAKLYKDYPEW